MAELISCSARLWPTLQDNRVVAEIYRTVGGRDGRCMVTVCLISMMLDMTFTKEQTKKGSEPFNPLLESLKVQTVAQLAILSCEVFIKTVNKMFYNTI